MNTITGASKYMVMGSTGIVTNKDGIPRPIKMLKILLPKTVPIARLFNPFLADVKTVKNSGAVVPNAKRIPANTSGILAIIESSTVL